MRVKIIFCLALVAVISLVLSNFGNASPDSANMFMALGIFALAILGFVALPRGYKHD